jgi:HlyD family type I secretion membrane fusion protein
MDNSTKQNGQGLAVPPDAPAAAAPATGKVKRPRKLPSGVADPRKIILTGMIIIALFFGGLVGWAALASIHGAVIASGRVKVEAERKTVQHLEGGIVESILVTDGDTVKAGQPLIRMESAQIVASADSYRKQRDKDLVMQARLQAEKVFKKSIEWPKILLDRKNDPSIAEMMASEEKVFQARRELFDGQVSLYQNQIDQIKKQIAGYDEQIRSEGNIIQSLEEERKAKQELYEGRYLERSQLLQLERELSSHQGQRGRLMQNVAEAKQKIGELSLRTSDVRNRWNDEVSGNLSKVEGELFQIQEKLRPLEDAQDRLVITAPVDGRVVDLKIHSPGGVVRPGEPLMDIVPENRPLIVEVKVPTNKITDVYVGQQAMVTLDAFDRRTVPPVPGTVTYVSADRLEEQTAQGKMPFYTAYVQLDEKALHEAGAYLYPGMPVTAFMTTKERTILAVILEPLEKNFERAMRN